MIALMMKEKTSRGFSSLDESVRVLLKYIYAETNNPFKYSPEFSTQLCSSCERDHHNQEPNIPRFNTAVF